MKKSEYNQTSTSPTQKSSKLLDIYIRNNKKQALLVHTPRQTNLEHIANLITTRFHVPPADQILFYEGEQLNENSSEGSVRLHDRAVLHLIDRRNINRQITINVRRLNIPKAESFRIPANQIIEDFIVRNIRDEEQDKMFMVYTGRQLRKDKSFQQEFVQNQSELFCLHEDRDQVKGERRKFYEGKVKKKQKSKKIEEDSSNGLENYLPKGNQTQEEEVKEEEKSKNEDRSQSPSSIEQQGETKPNFKKKNTLQEVNLAKNQQLKRSNAEGNLSEINDNNLQQSQSALNSQYFNDGSSISQITPYESHNPQSKGKLEEGSMFNSAYIGLANEAPGRPLQSQQIKQENSLENSSERFSFNFDTRAPEMIYQPPPDRQLTVLPRQIMEVTEESIENTSQETSSHNESKQRLNIPESKKQGEGSQQHSQFELGQIQNHLLSASAQMRVGDPTSPAKGSKSNNEILIEDEQNLQEPRSTQFNNAETNYVGIELETINQHPQESLSEVKVNRSNDRVEEFYEQKENSKETACFKFPSQELVELYVVQNQDGEQGQTPTASEVIEEKMEIETNHPSSSSNFYSKNSSRVGPLNPQTNQFQFGGNGKEERPGIQSRNVDRIHDKQEENHDTPKSQSGKAMAKSRQKVQSHDSEDLELQIVDLPLEIKAKENPSLLGNIDSDIRLTKKNESEKQYYYDEEKEEEKEVGKIEENTGQVHQESKINELNNLISDVMENNQPQKEEKKEETENEVEKDELSPKKNQNLEPNSPSLNKKISQVIIETSLLNRMNEGQAESSINNNLRESQQSLQQVRIKKTLASYSSGTKLLDYDVKGTPQKEHFAPGNLIFKTDFTHFDPLEFYVHLLQQETSQKQSQIF